MRSLAHALSTPAQDWIDEGIARRKRRLFRTAIEQEEARAYEMPKAFFARIVRKSLLRQCSLSRGSGEKTARGSQFHRIEFPCMLQSAARSLLWDITNKSGPHRCGQHEVFTWEIPPDKPEELDELCKFHTLRTGKKCAYYSGSMRQGGKVFVKLIPPFICEHKTNHDDISTLVMTFYTIEINRFGGVSWPTNPNLFSLEQEYTETETFAWALLFRFASDWRAPSVMHRRFHVLARRAAKTTNLNTNEDVPQGEDLPDTEFIDSSTSMESEGEEMSDNERCSTGRSASQEVMDLTDAAVTGA